MTLLDLTAELAHDMPRHPAPHLPGVELVAVATHDVHRRSVQRLTFGTHVSTHVDAPRHAIPDGVTVDEIPLDTLIGDAVLLRPIGVSKDNPIDVTHLRPSEELLKSAARVVIDTGWARQTWGQAAYFTEGPFLTRAASTYLTTFGIKLIAIDFPNIDSASETTAGLPAPNHVIVLGRGIVLVENVLHLDRIPHDRFRLTALPLRVIGGDGCPCRVVAEF